MSNATVIIDKIFGLIDKLFNLFKVFVKVFILILVGSFIFSLYYIAKHDDKSGSPQTCSTVAQNAQKAMEKRQAGVTLPDALKGVTDEFDQKLIVAIYQNSTVAKTQDQKYYEIETAYVDALGACIKSK